MVVEYEMFRCPCHSAGLYTTEKGGHLIEAYSPTMDCLVMNGSEDCPQVEICKYRQLLETMPEGFLWESACGWEEAEEKKRTQIHANYTLECIKHAMTDNRFIYRDLETDHYFWQSYNEFEKWQACFDFLHLHRKEICERFVPWAQPTDEEIAEVFFKLLNNWKAYFKEDTKMETQTKTAFAVYSETDNSLNFYKRVTVPTAGDTFDGRTATAVYTGFESDTYSYNSVPWKDYQSSITTSTVVDSGIQPVSTAYWFASCSSLTSVTGLDKLDTSSVTDMSSMFDNCFFLTTLNLSKWDTSAVTDMQSMFSFCSKLTTLDLSKWTTSEVTRMDSMFFNCKSLTSVGDLSGWNTSKVTNMGTMFFGCSALTADCSGWNVEKVTYHFSFNTNASGVKAPTWVS